ncbi:MAG TPA: RNA polymerase subunit sigma [Ruminococcaceae bacterium]|nr:RNA polymerase subunit sigma [Oscillospiraceae bacterium]
MTESEFEHYFMLYKETVWSAAFCYVKNAVDADDISQEVFLKLYTYSGEFSGSEHIRAWLLRCTVNRSKDHLRSHWQKYSEPLESIPEQEDTKPDDTDSLSEVFMKLSRKLRITMYLHYYQGYSVTETAKLLGISESAVGVRLMRGRKKLGKLLSEERNEYNGS